MYSKDSKLEAQVKTHAKTLGKDNVGVEAYKGKYRLNISRPYSRMHFPDSNGQKRITTGLSVLDANGKIDKANSDTVAAKVAQMHNDLANGYFDATLVKYGLVKLEVVDGGKKPQMTLLELYDWYCESRKGLVRESTLKLELKGRNRNAITQAIETVDENDAIAIRQWLIENRANQTTKRVLSHLDRAYQLGMRHKEIANNPFAGMASEINTKKQNEINDLNNEDENSDKRAFTIDEMNAIIEYFENRKQVSHLAPIVKFLFWTGCRTGEATGLIWRDIKWNNEVITFNRTYNPKLKIYQPLKNGTKSRWFPMPKDDKLWNLLKSIPQGNPDDPVFKAKEGGIIYAPALHKIWHGNKQSGSPGIIPKLIKQGKISQYLKLYATRHTFTSIQVNDFGVPPEVVAQWCGHDEKMSKKHYLERNTIIKPADMTSNPHQPQEALPIQVTEFLSGLTSEQIEQLKSLLGKSE